MPVTPLSARLVRPLAATDRLATAATERLSTGRRIVRAADDAAGASVAERLRARHLGLAAAEPNVLDGISLANVADGALAELHSVLQRTRELAVQWANGALGAKDRASITTEIAALGEEAERLYEGTKVNGLALLQGGALSVQAGAVDGDTIGGVLPDLADVLNEDPFTLLQEAEEIVVTTTETVTKGNGKGKKPPKVVTVTSTMTTPGSAAGTLERIDWAIGRVTENRAAFGALQNRLEHRLGALGAEREQMLSAESRIRDADVAIEAAALTRAGVMRHAQTALLAQAQRTDRGRVLALLA